MSVKKILVAAAVAGLSTTSAFAADLPARIYTKAPPIALAYDWSGFYFGVNAGLGLGRSPTSIGIPRTGETASANVGREGAIGGGQLGYNLQFGTWVLGLETDIQAANMRDNRFCGDECTPITARADTVDQRLNWFGTTRGRIGLATGPVLSYVTGGFAYGGVNTDVATSFGPNLSTGSFNQTRTGYTYGSGVEASLGGNWTGKLEYLYLNLGTQSGGFGTGPLPGVFNSEIREHIFRAGLNYRIGGNAAYAAAPVANWSGFYIGGNAGGALARNSTATNGINNVGGTFATETYELMPNGFLGGVQAGYNWQATNWVFGLETDIQGSTQKDNDNCMLTCATGGTFLMVDQRMSWLGTVRGRLGYSLGPTLFYGTAGLAYGGIENRTLRVDQCSGRHKLRTHQNRLDRGRRHRDALRTVRPVRQELDLEDRISLCRPRKHLGYQFDLQYHYYQQPRARAHLPQRLELPLQRSGGGEVLTSLKS